MRRVLLVAAVFVMMLAISPVFAYVYFNSDFNSDILANPGGTPPTYAVPRNWAGGSGLTAAMCPDRFCVVDAVTELGMSPEQGQIFRIHDSMTDVRPPYDPVQGYPAAISRTFSATTSGTVTLTFDVLFLQTGSTFRVLLCSDAVVTGVASWATYLIFEGNEPWGTPTQAGNLSYLSYWDLGPGSVNTTYNEIPDVTYDGWQWYTVKIEANVDTKKWRAYFGSKGTDPLPMILDWTDFVGSGTAQPGTQATKLAQAFFWTSNKTGTETEGLFYIDNVKVEGPNAPLSFNTVAEARMADKGAMIQLTDKVVTAGTDQFGAFFYIQDDGKPGAAMRVRYFNGAVHAGDRVDVTGMLVQCSDNGGPVVHNGEREIQSELVTIHPAHDPVPTPVALRNSQVSGGWLGSDEAVAGGPEPRLKGTWPSNKYGDAATYALGTNTMAPLYNTGSLVTTCGKVTRLCANDTAPYALTYPDIYIDDGSLKFDGCRAGSTTADPANPAPGIRIKISGAVAAQLPPIAIGDYVSVTGIAGAVGNSDLTTFYGSSGIRNIRVVRLRQASDLVKVDPPAPE